MGSEQPKQVELREDFPLSEVPLESRKSLWSISVVLLGFTFFTATMWGGGSIGVAFPFGELMGVIVLGNRCWVSTWRFSGSSPTRPA